MASGRRTWRRRRRPGQSGPARPHLSRPGRAWLDPAWTEPARIGPSRRGALPSLLGRQTDSEGTLLLQGFPRPLLCVSTQAESTRSVQAYPMYVKCDLILIEHIQSRYVCIGYGVFIHPSLLAQSHPPSSSYPALPPSLCASVSVHAGLGGVA
jgi:hypothetical protein